MIILILCAGEQTRWGDNDNPKQLVRVFGERLLDRQVRQLREHALEPTIVTHDPRLRVSESALEPTDRISTLNTLLSTRPLWNQDRTVVLLGDVVFTNDAIHRVLTCRDPIRVFGRQELQYRLVGQYYEMFAMTFAKMYNKRVTYTLQQAIKVHPIKCTLRTFYNVLCELPLKGYQCESTIFYPIEDWTEDIDAPEDYQQFVAMEPLLNA